MSKEEIFAGQRIMAWTLIGVLVVIIFFTILISGKCFSIITVNFKRLAEGMEQVKVKEFAIDRIAGEEGKLYFTIPACSILHLEVERV